MDQAANYTILPPQKVQKDKFKNKISGFIKKLN